MKTLDSAFQNQIAQPVTSITWCWLIERIDRFKLGFTSFDLSFSIDGVTYEPISGFAPSADSSEEGFKQSDSQNLQGILTSDRITDTDLIAGLYHYAKITCFHIDITNLPNSLQTIAPNFLVVYEGFLGKAKQSDRGFEIEVRKLDYLLETEIGKTTSKKCSHDLGDSNCKFNVATVTSQQTVNAVINQYTLDLGGAHLTGDYDRGKITFVTGKNQGAVRDISANVENRFTMFQPFPLPIDSGDIVEIVKGCDKALYTCFAKFNNVINCDKALYTCFAKFNNVINGDHEPHIPTQDQANSNPGS